MSVASPERELAWLANQEEAARAKEDPAVLLNRVKCIDSRSGEVFEFQLLDESQGWYWQRGLLDKWLEVDKWIGLKARQIGITWLAAGFGLWKGLATPGSTIIVISTNEEEASKVVNRIWDMYLSLPDHLKFGTKAIKPSRGTRPHTTIELLHPNGKLTRFRGLPATKKAGHGETSAVVILDEFSRQEYAPDIWKGTIPTMADGGKLLVISTANGVSNELTGEGNFFHHLWVNSEHYGIEARFLPWSLHPDRDQKWYDGVILPPKDKAEQYPNDADEAFLLTGDMFFSNEALLWYKKNAVKEPLFRAEFRSKGTREATLEKVEKGPIYVYELPADGGSYACAADIATGSGADYSAATVVNLSSGAIAAEFHSKLGADLYAYQLHYLGRWYNTAIIAPEMGGGYGEPVILALRNVVEGRPVYPKIYTHRQFDRGDLPEMKSYGFPMNQKTRPLVINQLEKWIRDREIPYMTANLLSECLTFVYAKSRPSPRAQDGCNDDMVMSAAIAYELFNQYGEHPKRVKSKKKKRVREYPWMRG